MPEASARTAALLSGQVDWIEAPAPDAIPQIKSKSFVLYTNAQPHVWPWQFSFAEGSPWLDKRVRQAANLCVDRAGLLKLLGGMMGVPKGTVPPAIRGGAIPSSTSSTIVAMPPRKLMAEAGHSAGQAAQGQGADLGHLARARCSRCR